MEVPDSEKNPSNTQSTTNQQDLPRRNSPSITSADIPTPPVSGVLRMRKRTGTTPSPPPWFHSSSLPSVAARHWYNASPTPRSRRNRTPTAIHTAIAEIEIPDSHEGSQWTIKTSSSSTHTWECGGPRPDNGTPVGTLDAWDFLEIDFMFPFERPARKWSSPSTFVRLLSEDAANQPLQPNLPTPVTKWPRDEHSSSLPDRQIESIQYDLPCQLPSWNSDSRSVADNLTTASNLDYHVAQRSSLVTNTPSVVLGYTTAEQVELMKAGLLLEEDVRLDQERTNSERLAHIPGNQTPPPIEYSIHGESLRSGNLDAHSLPPLTDGAKRKSLLDWLAATESSRRMI